MSVLVALGASCVALGAAGAAIVSVIAARRRGGGGARSVSTHGLLDRGRPHGGLRRLGQWDRVIA